MSQVNLQIKDNYVFVQFFAQTPQKTGGNDNNTSRFTIFAANKTALYRRFIS
jgi:hypothetical protein